ncbi:MAG: hypothetical protein K2P60_15775 [Lachnospiraceae bacterium]|nr:hypothetical protein [Lachnospiraceae bacterium]
MPKKYKNKCPASLSIYFTLLVVCTGTFILVLVEMARFTGLDSHASEYTKLAEESLFAGYQPVLLQEYDIFWLDGCFGEDSFRIEAGEEEMEALLYDNLSGKGRNFYKMRIDGVKAETYLLATDREGKIFQSQAAAAYKAKFGEIAIEEIRRNIRGIQDAKNGGDSPENKIAQADSALESIRQQQASQEIQQQGGGGFTGGGVHGKALPPSLMTSDEGGGTSVLSEGNPFETNRRMRSQGILSLVLPQGMVLSQKSVDIGDSLLKRKCRKGTDRETVKEGAADRILMQQYIKRYGGNFLSPVESGGLSYGEEYVIAGKGSDRENLEDVARELLLVREIANFTYICTDQAKQAQALAVATALAGISVNPSLIEVVKQGILAAWAYGESICDVKILLSGGKVPLIKRSGDWNTDLSHLGEVVSGNFKGTDRGQSYEDYLQAFMYLHSTKKTSYRCMDLMEFTMKKAGYEHAKMDGMILRMKIEAEYSTDTIFSSLLGEDIVGGYCFEKESSYCYR